MRIVVLKGLLPVYPSLWPVIALALYTKKIKRSGKHKNRKVIVPGCRVASQQRIEYPNLFCIRAHTL